MNIHKTVQVQVKRRIWCAFALLIVMIPSGLSGQSVKQQNTGITEQTKAVFLVNQSVYLDEKTIGSVELFQRLEKAMGKPLLNQYIPVSSGTAFLVSEDGYLVTASHVVRTVPDNAKWDSAQWVFLQYVTRNLVPDYLPAKDVTKACKVFNAYAKDAPVVISVKSSEKKEYRATVVAQKSDQDLALLKIDLDVKIKPVEIHENEKITESMVVYTIGYPLQFFMDKFLPEFKPTITNGIISAIRNDKWDIQHTASINPGNSGGPLLTENGKLIGVNVGQITNANGMYFAVISSKLVEWLKSINKTGILFPAEE